MIFSVALVGLFAASAANAAPIEDTNTLNSTKWTPDHVLQSDEVILYGEDGRMEIVHESVFASLFEKEGYALDTPELDHDYLNTTSKRDVADEFDPRDASLSPRAFSCGATNAVITDRTENFVDWDVQMSPVVIGTGNGIDVYVSQGYSVSNSINVGGSADWGVVKDKLKLSLGVDYTRTWTTQTVINIKGTVPNGYSGVMITRPLKTRRYGRTMQGCVGSMKQTGTFMADSYKEGSYNGVKWVSGAITMCTKKQFPLSRCHGGGNFI